METQTFECKFKRAFQKATHGERFKKGVVVLLRD